MKEQIVENPITGIVKQSIIETKDVLKLAVPFLTSFASSLLEKDITDNINEKKILTRFDETNINSFDLPTLEYMLDNGFEIHFDNNIHLKLYITDSKTYITSSNLTRGGFENNKELTVTVDTNNKLECNQIFDRLWEDSRLNIISKELLSENMPKYLILKKREQYKKNKKVKVETNIHVVGSLDMKLLIDEIFSSKNDNTNILDLVYGANKLREKFKNELIENKFNKLLFYVPEGHPKRHDNLFYNFVYGEERKLAGTGLREAQFKNVFEHKDFEKVITFIFPEIYGMEPWNFEDENIYLEFCTGLFDFDIPQYSESLPIRLASFFYPEYFIPIFKLEHLKKICDPLGIDTDAKTKGERLFAYNHFLNKYMKAVPYNNYSKSKMAYQILYSVELYKRLQNGEKYETIIEDYNKVWKKRYIKKAKQILTKVKAIQ